MTSVHFAEQAVQFNPTKVEAIFAKGMEVAALSCSLDGGRKIEKVEWFKNDTKISKLEKPDRFNVHTENNTLVIDQPGEAFFTQVVGCFCSVWECLSNTKKISKIGRKALKTMSKAHIF